MPPPSWTKGGGTYEDGGIITGSDQSKQWQRTNYQQQQRTVDNNYLLLAFAVILGVAFYRGL